MASGSSPARDGERVRLYSRPGNDLTNRFPLIVEAMARMPSCTLDGEASRAMTAGLHHSTCFFIASETSMYFSMPSI